MSQWSKCKVAITDLNVFKRMCEKHSLSYQENQNKGMVMQNMPVTAILKDQTESRAGGWSSHSEAYLCAKENAHHLVMDNDPSYSSIAARLGSGAGRLMRDYTQEMITMGVRKRGGMIQSASEKEDGSVLLRVSLG